MERIKMRIVPIIIFIILFSAILILPQTLIAAEDITYDVSKSWFKPNLIVNNNPAVCNLLLDGYMKYFKSTELINPLEADFTDQREKTDSIDFIDRNLHEIPWKVYESGDIYLKMAEFKINKKYFAVVRYYYSIGWREGFYYDMLISSPITNFKFDKNTIHKYFEDNNFGILAVGKETNAHDIIYKDDPRHADYNSNIYGSLANIYEKDGSIYILMETHKPNPHTYMLFKLINQKMLSLQGVLITTPTKEQIAEQYDKMLFFKALRSDLLDIMGNEGDCGTMHSLSNAKSALEGALDTMTYRPWAHENLSDARVAIDEGLARWGYSGIWNYYKYKSYLSNLVKSEKEINNFYQKNFLLREKQARDLGISALSHALTAGFIFSSQSQEENNNYDLEKDILEGMRASQLEKISVKEEKESSGRESLLTFAIAHPQLLEVLLKKGLNPNAQNDFGKTPLMYAAQFNKMESAKTLLKYGAATELTTIASGDTCNNVIETKNISALHYAVRYASLTFIKILLDAGAPTYMQDSNGYTPYDYLVKFGGFVGYKQLDKNSYGEMNQNLTIDDRKILKTILLPPDAKNKKDLLIEVNVRAEELYKKGKLDESYRLLKRAISLNPDNERAVSNLSLVALKLGKLGESAKLSTSLIDTAKSNEEKANAHFNLGLACQKGGQKGSTMEYDGIYYCRRDRYISASKRKDESAFANFLQAYILKPTEARLNTILAIMQNSDMPNKKRLCLLPKDTNGIKSMFFNGNDIYFLIDTDKDVPFKNISSRYGRDDRLLNIVQKESFKLSDNFKLEKWTFDGAPFGPIMMDDTICSPSFPNTYASSTKLIEVYSSDNRRTDRIIKVKYDRSEPAVIILYGNYIEWQLEGNLSNTLGIYVHGYLSAVKLPSSSNIPIFIDKNSAYEDPFGSSFNPYTKSVVGLVINDIFDVQKSDYFILDDQSVPKKKRFN